MHVDSIAEGSNMSCLDRFRTGGSRAIDQLRLLLCQVPAISTGCSLTMRVPFLWMHVG